MLRLAASADQLSPHVLAEAIVTEARPAVCRCRCRPRWSRSPAAASPPPSTDGGCTSASSRTATRRTAEWARAVVNRALLDGAAIAWVCVDGEPAGAVLLRDPLRRDAPRTLRRLRAAGLNRLVMLTGDRAEPAREVATVLGLDEVLRRADPGGQGGRRARRTRSARSP